MSDSTGSNYLYERMGGVPPGYWRLVLAYFARHSTEVATLDDLAGYIHG